MVEVGIEMATYSTCDANAKLHSAILSILQLNPERGLRAFANEFSFTAPLPFAFLADIHCKTTRV